MMRILGHLQFSHYDPLCPCTDEGAILGGCIARVLRSRSFRDNASVIGTPTPMSRVVDTAEAALVFSNAVNAHVYRRRSEYTRSA